MPGEKGDKGETGLPGPQVSFLFFSLLLSALEFAKGKKTVASEVSWKLGSLAISGFSLKGG